MFVQVLYGVYGLAAFTKTAHAMPAETVLCWKGTWMHLEDMQVTVCGKERRGTFTSRNMVSGEVACDVVVGYIYFPNLGARCDQLKMKIGQEEHDWKHCRIEQHHSYEINIQKAVSSILMHSNCQAFQHFKGNCLIYCGGRKRNCAHRAVHLQ